MGEFEQAKPIIAALKQRHPDVRIIVSFFSPSGYEHSRKYPLADVITYIPFDSRRGARQFLDLVRPDVAVMVRYDIWPNHIWELRRRSDPGHHRQCHDEPANTPQIAGDCVRCTTPSTKVSTPSSPLPQSDVEAFRAFRLRHPLWRPSAIRGTTRSRPGAPKPGSAASSHRPCSQGKKVLVAGSTWPEDEEVLLPAFLGTAAGRSDLLLILVPHEPTLEHIEGIERELSGQASTIRFSALNEYAERT